MMRNNPNLDLVNMKAYIKLGEILSILRGNKILTSIKGQNSVTNMRKMICYNPNLNLINMKAYIKFGEVLSIC